MKELEPHINDRGNIKTELTVKKKQEIEYVLEGVIKPERVHFIWELNEVTGEIKKSEFKKTTSVFGAVAPKMELIINPDCIYIAALNASNAKKKYQKNKNQINYFVKKPPFNINDITF